MSTPTKETINIHIETLAEQHNTDIPSFNTHTSPEIPLLSRPSHTYKYTLNLATRTSQIPLLASGRRTPPTLATKSLTQSHFKKHTFSPSNTQTHTRGAFSTETSFPSPVGHRYSPSSSSPIHLNLVPNTTKHPLTPSFFPPSPGAEQESPPKNRPLLQANNMMKGQPKGKSPLVKAYSEPSPFHPTKEPVGDSPKLGASTRTSLQPTHTSQLRSQDPSTPQHTQALVTPTYHIARPARKVADWNIKGIKSHLFIGDSNLNRIPPFQNPRAQVDSYPGATFHHFQKVLEKTQVHPHTEVVVLSVGLNNKDLDPYQTSLKQLGNMYREAKSTFPNATIYVPIISHSPLLTPQHKQNIKIINSYISKHLPTLYEIPHDAFYTNRDNIHWTPETAAAIFAHWCSQLNL